MKNEIYVHINFFENCYSLEKSFAECKRIGYNGIEIRDRDNSGKLPILEYLGLTRNLSEKYSLSILYGCHLDTTSEDSAMREKSLLDFLTVIDSAGKMGIRTLNVFGGRVFKEDWLSFSQNGSTIATDAQWEQTAKMLKISAEKAYGFGIELCLETHNGYIHDLPVPTIKLLNMIDMPNVKANYDQGNIQLNKNGTMVEESINILSGRIGYVHLKNIVQPHGCSEGMFFATHLKCGDINNYVLIKKLLNTGYRGILCIENIMNGDKRSDAIDDLVYVKEILKGANCFA